ncbi:MAG: carbon starvation protein A [Actinomycetaceae bacterium]|nr:carbon starvation protein A [Actinomycetaceae bacterium]
MNSLLLAVIGITMMLLGYFVYSKWVASSVLKLDENYQTPAHSMKDGVDYVPTKPLVLWGHHFTSVAGAAPIVGPAIAVIWGWLPAFLWVTLGTIFFAGMHDFGVLWASARHRGKSIGSLSGRYIGRRGRGLFLVVIFLVLLMVNSAFAVVIANLLTSTPSSVIPTWGALVVAVLVGQAIYRLNWNLPIVSIVGVVALYSLIMLGDMYPVVLPDTVLGMGAKTFWIVVLFLYAGIASMLPVWVLLQPRDYINGLQLFVGLGLLYISVLISRPTIVAPALNSDVPAGTPSIVPLLFVTIACGAVSGFHGMVASGTTSKQLDKEPHARFVGYFGAVGEGLLSLGAIIATTAGFQSLANWKEIYSAFGEGGVGAFVNGGGTILESAIHIPHSLSTTVLATMAVLFAATTMDTGVRLQRFVVQEVADMWGVKLNPVAATGVVLAICLGLAFSAGGDGAGGMIIWPLFGTTNQLMAALSLSIVAVILLRLGRPALPAIIPFAFILTVALYALVVQIGTFYGEGNWLLLGLDIIILVAAIVVSIESVRAMVAAKKTPNESEEMMAENIA